MAEDFRCLPDLASVSCPAVWPFLDGPLENEAWHHGGDGSCLLEDCVADAVEFLWW